MTLSRMAAVLGCALIAGALAGLAWADSSSPAAPESQLPAQVREPTLLATCDGASASEARRLADEAVRQRRHRRAAECFEAAGERARADRSLAEAFASESAATSRRISSTAHSARAQARQIRDAFRKPRD
jgi:hypothetical protein